ncbi:MAG TPA: hypothetical protein VLS49_10300 [Usitatibacter sp.]|nr:hypothetical protein [Usitatibacter sp.]
MPPDPSLRPRILLASTQEAELVLRRALRVLDADLLAAHRCESALRWIAQGIDLMVCTMRFDESRMLDLAVTVERDGPHVPFVACRVLASELPRPSLEAAFTAARELGAAATVDLPRIARREGAARAEEQLRRIVLANLHGVGYASMS